MSSNPYQTPEGQLTHDDQAYGEIKFFSPSSRINRLRYWAHSMLFTFAAIGVFIIIALVAAVLSQTLALILGVITYVAMVVYSFILMIQRLHDLNKSGWMSLLAIVPLANIYLIVLIIFFKGTEGRNDYGLQTPPNKTWHWIMALSFPALMIAIGILAAIALPAYQSYVERAQGFDSSYDSQDAYPDAGADYLQSDEMTDEGLESEEMIDAAPYDEFADGAADDELPELDDESSVVE